MVQLLQLLIYYLKTAFLPLLRQFNFNHICRHFLIKVISLNAPFSLSTANRAAKCRWLCLFIVLNSQYFCAQLAINETINLTVRKSIGIARISMLYLQELILSCIRFIFTIFFFKIHYMITMIICNK